MHLHTHQYKLVVAGDTAHVPAHTSVRVVVSIVVSHSAHSVPPRRRYVGCYRRQRECDSLRAAAFVAAFNNLPLHRHGLGFTKHPRVELLLGHSLGLRMALQSRYSVAGPGRCCAPRHLSKCQPSCLELADIIRRGKQYLPGQGIILHM